ncbi:M56 family metallopeptidase [uncultured Eubacterium sp.]|uniref:M56 family metallopeptidase n=1 Tax=uncultured Eubacterium sp. TaxID=165185 RepID=UPI0025E05496|nr:M56 family metallopeptidase [uncultured Eubacterium sp.]
MNWINFFFLVIILNTLTGTVAYFLCKLLTLIAKKRNAIRIIYPLHRMVLLFYIVPFGYLYICFKFQIQYGTHTIGDGFYGNSMLYLFLEVCLAIWVLGMIWYAGYYTHKWQNYRWICRNNLPFRGEKYREMLQNLYPNKNWKRITFCTNFTIKSPCVMGAFSQKIVLPEIGYSDEDMKIILMHEGMHIVRKDNLGKKIALGIILVNWFNPILHFYLDDLDAWSDIACDIRVCKQYFMGKAKVYFNLLRRASESGQTVLPPFVSQLNNEESLRRRVEYMIKWQKSGKRTCLSVALAMALIIGSSVSAFASSVQVVDQQDELYRETRMLNVSDEFDTQLEQYVIPADQVDEEKWNNAIVMEEESIEPLSVQKNFDWKIPANKFARSAGFIKKKGTSISVSCYIYSERYQRVGIRRPDGSMLYVNGFHNVASTFPCDATGTYYVFVENITSTQIRAAGYYVK